MNMLRLIKLLYSRTFLKEILVFLQVVLMTMLLVSVVTPFENIKINTKALESNLNCETNQLLYFSTVSDTEDMYNIRPQNETANMLVEEIKNAEGVQAVGRIFERYSYHENGTKAINAKFVVYCQEIIDKINIPLETGYFDKTLIEFGALPVVIGGAMANYYTINDTFKLERIGPEDVDITCVVTGIFRNNASFITFGEQNAPLSYNTAIDTNAFYIFSAYSLNILGELNWSTNMLVEFMNDSYISEMKDNFKYNYETQGRILEISEIQKNQTEQIINNSSFNFLMLILFTLVLIFGYGGYTIITSMQKRKLYAIMYINGMPFYKMLLLNLMSGIAIFLPAVVIGLFFAPMFYERTSYANFLGFTASSYFIVISIFAVTFIFSISSTIVQTKRTSTILLYNTN